MSKYYSAAFTTEISDFFIAKWVMKDKDKFDHFASLQHTSTVAIDILNIIEVPTSM